MTIWWLAFIVIFVVVYAVDLFVTINKKEEKTVQSSLKWSALWLVIALAFGVIIYFFFPQNPDSSVNTSKIMGMKFISGYLTEYSLSVDNLFVFIMIFSMLGISSKNQPKLLIVGILISVILRILFIVLGMELVERFHWIIYLFGAILVWTSYKMVAEGDDKQVDPKSNFLYKTVSKIFPVDPNPDTPYFITKIKGKRHITNMFLALMVVGSTDILFAIDSIPAIIGVIKEGTSGVLTLDEENYLAISSNVFAVMGLVSLFFALKGVMGMFRYLKIGVSLILFFIGLKMLLTFFKPVEHFFSQYSWVSLAVIITTLTLSVIFSVIIPEKKN